MEMISGGIIKIAPPIAWLLHPLTHLLVVAICSISYASMSDL
ncbi:hypothetical protein AZE42_13578 [Rhizopogon vesiculosus]|uniref:Uncharacterized protein n=1 Tax=Rhizopogon vesiculosus TaxID=180088 RepID=A0A1J8QNI9_9AGAM|nr:hypothetical protein AZE42_13578 [Rhizopogon vesiculosus]